MGALLSSLHFILRFDKLYATWQHCMGHLEITPHLRNLKLPALKEPSSRQKVEHYRIMSSFLYLLKPSVSRKPYMFEIGI